MSQLKHRVDRLYRRTHGFIPACDLRFLIRFFEDLYAKHPKTADFEERITRFRSVYGKTGYSSECDEAITFGRQNKAFVAQIFLDSTRMDIEQYPNGRWVPKSKYEMHLVQMRHAVAHFRRTNPNSRG